MQLVEIRVEGHLDKQWGEWLDGLAITHAEGNATVLTGTVADQAALYGLIGKLRDLGLKLSSVSCEEIKEDHRATPPQIPTTQQDGSR
jgi:hypothetical protein